MFCTRFIAALLVGVTAATLWAPADDKQNKKDKADAANARERRKAEEKIVSGPPFRGKIIRIDPAQRFLTVQVKRKIPQQNLQAVQNLANLQAQLIDASRRKDFNGVVSTQTEIAKNKLNLYTFHDEELKLEIECPDNVKVRTLLRPIDYDEKGRPKRLTEKEKKEL